MDMMDGEECLVIDATRPSKAVKQVEQLKGLIRRTKLLNSDKLKGLTLKNIGTSSMVTSQIFRQILELNKRSLQHIGINYKTDVIREETRILFEELTLEEFPNLTSLTLQMNRAYLL